MRHSQVMQVERNEQRSLGDPVHQELGEENLRFKTFPIRMRIGYLQKKFSGNLRQIPGVPEITQFQFSINEAIWGTFMNSCMWASVYLDQFQRVLRNMYVGEIQQISSTTQNQTQSLQQTCVWPARRAGLGSESMEVLYCAARQHLHTI